MSSINQMYFFFVFICLVVDLVEYSPRSSVEWKFQPLDCDLHTITNCVLTGRYIHKFHVPQVAEAYISLSGSIDVDRVRCGLIAISALGHSAQELIFRGGGRVKNLYYSILIFPERS